MYDSPMHVHLHVFLNLFLSATNVFLVYKERFE